MTSVTPDNTCRSDEIAAYLDGELAESARCALERHLAECAPCAEQLREQRRLLCALDMALSGEHSLPIPKDFARVVAAHAQSDMSGVRARSENRRALCLCLLLATVSAILIGSAALSDAALAPFWALAKPAATVMAFFGRMLYNVGAGLAVISRLGGRLLFESRPLGLFGCLLFAAALALLPRLIISYHRTRIT
ncbi:MAG TPA: zf-HC2 domain-containing protein [Pyrinomonadaceae bacterium]